MMINTTSKKNKLGKIHLFLALLFISFFVTTAYIVTLKWQLPLSDLFQPTSKLMPNAMVAQLVILAQTGVSICAGGLLAVVSLLLQQVVRNNLASDTTLAIGSGAQLLMLAVIVFFPSWGLFGSFWVAFIGAICALGLVVLIALPSKLNPMVMILAGLVVNILCSALVSLVMVFYSNYVNTLLAWSMGYLFQDNWFTMQAFIMVSIAILFFVLLFHKPLTIMSLDDQQAKQLGVPVHWLRMAVFLVCAMVSSFVVSRVGLIGFIGLGAATVVNVLNVRSIRTRLVLGFIVGALLLTVANNCIIILEHFVTLPRQIPAGILTGLLGAPIILWLIIKQRKQSSANISENTSQVSANRKPINWWQFILSLGLVLVVALFFVNSHFGWHFDWGMVHNHDLFNYRWIRTITAATTGILLAVAGLLLQRITQNPMASPEVLGISSAAAIAMIIAFLVVGASPLIIFGAGVLGSFLIMLLLLWLMRFVSVNYLLFIGIAIAAIMNGFTMLLALIDDPRLQAVLGWLSGSTYYAQPMVAYVLLAISILSVLICFLLFKPITILSLNDTIARSLGIRVRFMQSIILVLIAMMSTFATMAVGPLSFIGLMTPHLAKSMGAVQLEKQLPLSAILGAFFMIVADWLGRYLLFPFEISAGVLAAIIGCGYFLVLIRKLN